jgi:hypothetical protein
MKHVIAYVAALFGILVLGCIVARAEATCQIAATVDDPSGARLPAIEITATQTALGLVRSVITNEICSE